VERGPTKCRYCGRKLYQEPVGRPRETCKSCRPVHKHDYYIKYVKTDPKWLAASVLRIKKWRKEHPEYGHEYYVKRLKTNPAWVAYNKKSAKRWRKKNSEWVAQYNRERRPSL
jgi:hypothetical protein